MNPGTKDLSPKNINNHRLEAVRLRLDGLTVAEVAARTGLSAPTVSAAWKAFRSGGWEAVPVRQRGRKAGQAKRLDEAAQDALIALLASQPDTSDPAWSSRALATALTSESHRLSPRAIDHWLETQDLKPSPLALEGLSRRSYTAGRWYRQQVAPVLEHVRTARGDIWQGGTRVSRPGEKTCGTPRRYQLYLHGKRGALFTRCLLAPPMADDYLALFERLLAGTKGPAALLFHGAFFQASPEIQTWLAEHPELYLINVPPNLRPGSAPSVR